MSDDRVSGQLVTARRDVQLKVNRAIRCAPHEAPMYSATFALTAILGIALTNLFLGFAFAVLIGRGPRSLSDVEDAITIRYFSPQLLFPFSRRTARQSPVRPGAGGRAASLPPCRSPPPCPSRRSAGRGVLDLQRSRAVCPSHFRRRRTARTHGAVDCHCGNNAQAGLAAETLWHVRQKTRRPKWCSVVNWRPGRPAIRAKRLLACPGSP